MHRSGISREERKSVDRVNEEGIYSLGDLALSSFCQRQLDNMGGISTSLIRNNGSNIQKKHG